MGSLFNKSATLANTVSGFKTSGIFPLKQEIIPEHEYIDIHGNKNETEESP